MSKIQITDTRIKELVNQGLRHKEIANQLSEDTGVNVTVSWVKSAMKQLNIRLKRAVKSKVELVTSQTASVDTTMPEEYKQIDEPFHHSDDTL